MKVKDIKRFRSKDKLFKVLIEKVEKAIQAGDNANIEF